VTLGELSVPIAWYERVILLREEEAQEPVAALSLHGRRLAEPARDRSLSALAVATLRTRRA
jgi:hypothetical protein